MPTPEGTPLRSRLVAWGFFVLLVALSTRLMASAVRRGVLLTEESPLLYHAATLGFSYFDFGFVRRGLAGSIVPLPSRLLARDRPAAATAVFHCCSALPPWRAAPRPCSCTCACAQAHERSTRCCSSRSCCAGPKTRAGTDLAVAALLIAAVLAFQAKKLVLSCLCVGLSLGVHETGLVFGLSLLAGLLLDGARWRQVTAAHRRGGPDGPRGLRCALCAARHAAARRRSDDGVGRAFSLSPTHEYVDWAIYFAVSGSRGVRTLDLPEPRRPARIPCTWQRVWA